jgi:hypothetical protein
MEKEPSRTLMEISTPANGKPMCLREKAPILFSMVPNSSVNLRMVKNTDKVNTPMKMETLRKAYGKIISLNTLETFHLRLLVKKIKTGLDTCPDGYNKATWNQCVGAKLFFNGAKYKGEWKNGRPDGSGSYLTPMAIITLDSLRLTSQKGKASITLPTETSTSVDGGTRNRWGMVPILMPKEMNTLVNLKMANHMDAVHIPGA